MTALERMSFQYKPVSGRAVKYVYFSRKKLQRDVIGDIVYIKSVIERTSLTVDAYRAFQIGVVTVVIPDNEFIAKYIVWPPLSLYY